MKTSPRRYYTSYTLAGYMLAGCLSITSTFAETDTIRENQPLFINPSMDEQQKNGQHELNRQNIDNKTSEATVINPQIPEDNETENASSTDIDDTQVADDVSPVLDAPPPAPIKIDPAELLTRARQVSSPNVASQTSATSSSQINLPAFRNLMDAGIQHLQRRQLAEAESYFTRAQRLAPQSSAVYFYLGQVALQRNQPYKAESMARRGLMVVKNTSRKQALHQIIERAEHMRSGD